MSNKEDISDILILKAVYAFLIGAFFAVGTLMAKMGFDIWFSNSIPLEILAIFDKTFPAGMLVMGGSAILMIAGAILQHYGR